MSAGLPGLGLGGLFFILSALAAPLVELVRTARGESDAASWLGVGRNFTLAVVMIAAVDGALRLAYLALDLSGLGDSPSASAPMVLPLLPVAITAGLLATVLSCAKGMQLAALARSRGLPRLVPASLPGRVRVVAGGVVVTAGWFALLLFGASELSPIDTAPESRSDIPESAIAEDRGATAEAASAPQWRPIVVRPVATGSEGIRAAGNEGSEGAPLPAASTFSAPTPGEAGSLGGNGPTGPKAPAAPTGVSETPVPVVSGPSGAGGPPSHAGPSSAAGPPEHAAATAGAGPPDHAGPPDDAGEPDQTGPARGLGPALRDDHQTVGSTRNSTRVP